MSSEIKKVIACLALAFAVIFQGRALGDTPAPVPNELWESRDSIVSFAFMLHQGGNGSAIVLYVKNTSKAALGLPWGPGQSQHVRIILVDPKGAKRPLRDDSPPVRKPGESVQDFALRMVEDCSRHSGSASVRGIGPGETYPYVLPLSPEEVKAVEDQSIECDFDLVDFGGKRMLKIESVPRVLKAVEE